jgi:hypothetical protein
VRRRVTTLARDGRKQVGGASVVGSGLALIVALCRVSAAPRHSSPGVGETVRVCCERCLAGSARWVPAEASWICGRVGHVSHDGGVRMRRLRFEHWKRWMRQASAPVGAFATVLVWGCSDPAGCDVCFTIAVAYGTVTGASGTAVRGVPVDVRVFQDVCGGISPGGSDNNQGSRVTTQTGEYRRILLALDRAVTHCARVFVNPNGDPRWPSYQQDFDVVVEFRPGMQGDPPDSVRMDVVVPTS